MTVDTLRFGQIEIDEGTIITFEEGLPGLEEYREYAIINLEESYPIVWLQCVTHGDICLPVVNSFLLLPDYEFDIEEEYVDKLLIEGLEDLFVVSVLVIPDALEQMTINQVAPILINTRTRTAAQIILGGSQYNPRLPAYVRISELIQEGGQADAGAVEKAE